MEIELQLVKLKDIFEGYIDTGVEGVEGYNGLLDIRPPYQRETVIDTVTKGFPLNVMYWAVRNNDKEKPFEIIDGQQRTLSICKYINRAKHLLQSFLLDF